MAVIYATGISSSGVSALGYPKIVYHGTATATMGIEELAIGRYQEEVPVLAFGNLEILLSVIGESDTNLGGYRITRIIDTVAQGSTTIPVENSLDWEGTGKIYLDGVIYNYTHCYNQVISGLSYEENGVIIPGTKKQHLKNSSVAELKNGRSALTRVRNAMLVDYAVSDDLSVVGRNLGVLRSPFLTDDEVYRSVIKALAYNPKGTVYGIELALDAVFGRGNYNIYTDPIRYPCVVFITLSTKYLVTDTLLGHSYLEYSENSLVQSDGSIYDLVELSQYPVDRGCVGSIKWSGMDFLTTFDNKRPSSCSVVDYEGDLGSNLWEYSGLPALESDYVDIYSDYIDLKSFHSGIYANIGYQLFPRFSVLGRETDWVANILFMIPSGYCTNASANQFGLQVIEGSQAKNFGWGIAYSSGLKLRWIDNGTPIVTDLFDFSYDTWYEVQLEKSSSQVKLLVDGCEISTYNYADFGSTLWWSQIRFGVFTTSTDVSVYIKQAGIYTKSHQDFVSYLELFGNITGTGLADEIEFSTNAALSRDVGHFVIVQDSTAVNAYGGNNNGVWKVLSYIDNHTLQLIGENHYTGKVDTGDPTRIEVDFETDTFTFPDDLGREIVISNSTHGNNGTYVITKLLQLGTYIDLSTFDTPIRQKTNACEVTIGGLSPSFVTESGLTVYEKPTFTAEANIPFYVDSAGLAEIIGSTPFYHLRDEVPLITGLPFNAPLNAAVDTHVSKVLTSQVLEDSSVTNTKISDIPIEYSYYPFYLNDPLGLLNYYIDGLVVAGVITSTSIED